MDWFAFPPLPRQTWSQSRLKSGSASTENAARRPDGRCPAMSKEQQWYIETENLLRIYWRSKERLLRLQAKEKVLKASLEKLKKNLIQSKAIPGYARKYGIISWEARKGDFDYSTVMVEYENLIDEISRELVKNHRALVRTQRRIQELLEFISSFELIFNRLTEEEQKLTEGKYLLNLSNYQIADILHCSEKRVRTMQKKILYKIADWSGKVSPAGLAM